MDFEKKEAEKRSKRLIKEKRKLEIAAEKMKKRVPKWGGKIKKMKGNDEVCES